jgi:hypothetical protein
MAITWEEHEFARQVVQAAGRGMLGQLVNPYPAPPSPLLVAHAPSASTEAPIPRIQCTSTRIKSSSSASRPHPSFGR